MAYLVGSLLVAAVAAALALPFLRGRVRAGARDRATGADTLRREKHVALMAIREAEFDRATGKLSERDYALLRSQYEERAMLAIRELERETVVPAAPQGVPRLESAGAAARLAAYCHRCGHAFGEPDRYCARCGAARVALAAPTK